MFGPMVYALVSLSPAHAGVADVRDEVQECLLTFERDEAETLQCFVRGARRLLPATKAQLGRDFTGWRRQTEDACEAQVADEGGTKLQRDLKGVRCIYQAMVRELGE